MYTKLNAPFDMNFKRMERKQAESYLAWFIDQIPGRIRILSEYIRANPKYPQWMENCTPQSLRILGAWFVENTKSQERSSEEMDVVRSKRSPRFQSIPIDSFDLSSDTASFCVDVGMYFSQTLLTNNPGLHWKLVVKPKNSADYQQPVIAGNGKMTLNPVRIVFTYAYGILRKSRGSGELEELYYIWKGMLLDE